MDIDATTPFNTRPAEPARPGRAGSDDSGKAVPSGGQPLPQSGPATVEQAISQIEAFLSSSQRQLTFERHEATGRMIIRVIDPASGEIIRQFPAEEILKLAAIIEARGFRMLNERV